jgi:hypothetical protein
MKKTCGACGKTDESSRRLKRCTGCMSVLYCNATCQKAHRKQHKDECKQIALILARSSSSISKKIVLADAGNGTGGQKATTRSTKASSPVASLSIKDYGKISNDGRNGTCWICLDEMDNDGQPACRSCVCRGDNNAGAAHLSCLAKFAKSKSDNAAARFFENPLKACPAVILQEYRFYWSSCPNCQQFYTGDMSIQLAEMFLAQSESSSVLENDMGPLDFRRLVPPLSVAHAYRISDRLNESRLIFWNLYTLIQSKRTKKGTLKGATTDLIEYIVVLAMGELEAKEGKFAIADDILSAYLESLPSDYGISTSSKHRHMIQRKIEQYKRMANGTVDTQYAVMIARNELAFYSHTRQDPSVICDCKMGLFLALLNNRQEDEAMKIGKELVKMAERVLGKEHKKTTLYRSLLKKAQVIQFCAVDGATACLEATVTGFAHSPQLNNLMCIVVKKTTQGKYIALVQPEGDDSAVKYEVLRSNLIFHPGTMILCKGLQTVQDGTTGTIRSYQTETLRYEVELPTPAAKIKKLVLMKQENLMIVSLDTM